MRHLFLAVLAITVTAPKVGAQVVSLDFESLPVGAYLVQTAGSPWETGVLGGAGDVLVSNAQAHNGDRSVLFDQADGIGTRDSVVLNLPNVNSDVYEMRFWLFVPDLYGVSFTLYDDSNNATADKVLQVYLRADGEPETSGNAVFLSNEPYPHDIWIEAKIVCDFQSNAATFIVNGDPKVAWATNYTTGFSPCDNQLGAIEFTAQNTTAPIKYYLDDISLDISVGMASLGQERSPLAYPNPTKTTISLNGLGSSRHEYSIFDSVGGNCLQGGSVSEPGILDVSNLPSGFYVIQTMNTLGVKRRTPFVKE
ncbi:MAG: T9SS type A sorting domain-containing protein [Flavobacteriales bacterium]|nr:T9SS type A sorting domain-containing protein [Flavobacteriales bacterium]